MIPLIRVMGSEGHELSEIYNIGMWISGKKSSQNELKLSHKMFAHVIRTHVDGQKLGGHTHINPYTWAHVAIAVAVRFVYMMKIPNRNENGQY